MLRRSGTIDDLWDQCNSFQSFIIEPVDANSTGKPFTLGTWQLVGRLKVTDIKSTSTNNIDALDKTLASTVIVEETNNNKENVVINMKKLPEMVQSVTGNNIHFNTMILIIILISILILILILIPISL